VSRSGREPQVHRGRRIKEVKVTRFQDGTVTRGEHFVRVLIQVVLLPSGPNGIRIFGWMRFVESGSRVLGRELTAGEIVARKIVPRRVGVLAGRHGVFVLGGPRCSISS
jgi:hypothetical protein